MQEKIELQNYIKLIKKSYSSFREQASHISNDALDWKINKFSNSPRWIISHVIFDQYSFTSFIVSGKTSNSPLEIEQIEGDLDILLESYDRMVKETIDSLLTLKGEDLKLVREIKNYKITVEELLFEYIYHINHHSGQLVLILSAWKRENREPKKEEN